METFQLDDLNEQIPREVSNAICNLLMAWPNIEAGVSRWLADLLGLQSAEAIILFGRMDTWAKLERIVELVAHRGDSIMLERVQSLKRLYQGHSAVRNILAHAPCVGVLYSKPSQVVFAPFKLSQKDKRDFLVQELSLDGIKEAYVFVGAATSLLIAMIQGRP